MDNQLDEDLVNAAKNHDIASVLALLGRGANPNYRDSQGRTPLHYFVSDDEQYINIVTQLLYCGANPNIHDINGKTPLHLAASSHIGGMRNFRYSPTSKIISLLLESKADPNLCEEKGETPFYWALLYKKHELTTLLLNNGADPEYTLLLSALYKKWLPIEHFTLEQREMFLQTAKTLLSSPLSCLTTKLLKQREDLLLASEKSGLFSLMAQAQHTLRSFIKSLEALLPQEKVPELKLIESAEIPLAHFNPSSLKGLATRSYVHLLNSSDPQIKAQAETYLNQIPFDLQEMVKEVNSFCNHPFTKKLFKKALSYQEHITSSKSSVCKGL